MGMPVITHGTGTRCQAITDIVASVALEQAALSHILNAEGEKLQKVISLTGVSLTELPHPVVTPEQLLETNKSVEKMVNAVARLEMVLQAKLELFEDCLCTPCDHRPTDEEVS